LDKSKQVEKMNILYEVVGLLEKAESTYDRDSDDRFYIITRIARMFIHNKIDKLRKRMNNGQ